MTQNFQTKHAKLIEGLSNIDLRVAYAKQTETHAAGWFLVDGITTKSRYLGKQPSDTVIRLIAEDLLTARYEARGELNEITGAAIHRDVWGLGNEERDAEAGGPFPIDWSKVAAAEGGAR